MLSKPWSAEASPPADKLVDVHDAVNQVRAMPEFRPQDQNPLLEKLAQDPTIKGILDEARKQLEKLLEAFVKMLSHMKPVDLKDSPNTLEQAYSYAVIGLVAFLGLVVFYLLLGVARRWMQGREKPPRPTHKSFGDMPLLGSEKHRQSAQSFATNGEYEEAVRQLYLALLCHLDETHLVAFEANRTNLEYLRELRKLTSESFQKGFRQVAATFESMWYGQRPGSQSAYEICLETYQNLSATTTAGRGDAGPGAAGASSRV